MAQDRTKAHIPMPAIISAIVDRLMKRRHAQTFVTGSASGDRALLERQKVALARTAGILKDAENPDWATPELTSAWVRKQRAIDNQATEDKLSSRTTP